MSLMFIMCLAGCEREEKTELHFYTKPNVNYQMAYIIYEIYGCLLYTSPSPRDTR